MVLSKKNKIKKAGMYSKKSKESYKNALNALATQNMEKEKQAENLTKKIMQDREKKELEKAQQLAREKQNQIDKQKKRQTRIKKHEKDLERNKKNYEKKIKDSFKKISCDLYQYEKASFEYEKSKNQFDKIKIQEFMTFLKKRINQNIQTYTIIYEGSDNINPDTGTSEKIDFKFLFNIWWKESVDRKKYKQWGYENLRGPNDSTDWLRKESDVLIKEKKLKDENEFHDRINKQDYENATPDEKIKLDEIEKFINEKEEKDTCLPYKLDISDEDLNREIEELGELENFELPERNNLSEFSLQTQNIGGTNSRKIKKKKKWSKKYKRLPQKTILQSKKTKKVKKVKKVKKEKKN